jgi:hypothetical protein
MNHDASNDEEKILSHFCFCPSSKFPYSPYLKDHFYDYSQEMTIIVPGQHYLNRQVVRSHSYNTTSIKKPPSNFKQEIAMVITAFNVNCKFQESALIPVNLIITMICNLETFCLNDIALPSTHTSHP